MFRKEIITFLHLKKCCSFRSESPKKLRFLYRILFYNTSLKIIFPSKIIYRFYYKLINNRLFIRIFLAISSFFLMSEKQIQKPNIFREKSRKQRVKALLDFGGIWIAWSLPEIIPVWDLCTIVARKKSAAISSPSGRWSARRHVMRHREICLLIREYSNAKTSFDFQLTARGEVGK